MSAAIATQNLPNADTEARRQVMRAALTGVDELLAVAIAMGQEVKAQQRRLADLAEKTDELIEHLKTVKRDMRPQLSAIKQYHEQALDQLELLQERLHA